MTQLAATIRPARPSDAAAMARVHVETWRATYAGLLPDRYLIGLTKARQKSNWNHWIASPGKAGAVLVAESPDQPGSTAQSEPAVVGFGTCGRLRASGLSQKGEIFTLYVANDWQGRGIGKRLVTALFEALVQRGIGDAALWVLADNPSRFFYEAMGGQRVAERREAFAGTLVDEMAYAWPDLHAWLERSRG